MFKILDSNLRNNIARVRWNQTRHRTKGGPSRSHTPTRKDKKYVLFLCVDTRELAANCHTLQTPIYNQPCVF